MYYGHSLWLERQVTFATPPVRVAMVLSALEASLARLSEDPSDAAAFRRAVRAAGVLLGAFPEGSGPERWAEFWSFVLERLSRASGDGLASTARELLPAVRRLLDAVREVASR